MAGRKRPTTPAGKRDLDVVVPLQPLFGGYNDTRTPMDAARGPSATAMNRNDAAGGKFNNLRSAIGPCGKWVVGFGRLPSLAELYARARGGAERRGESGPSFGPGPPGISF
jgi:hypothetical protein